MVEGDAMSNAQADAEPKVIVKIKPGSSSEKGLTFLLPEDKLEGTIDEVIAYGLANPDNRGDARIIERIKTEMSRDDYGIVAGNKTAQRSHAIDKYLVDKETADHEAYRELTIVIAKPQEGGMFENHYI